MVWADQGLPGVDCAGHIIGPPLAAVEWERFGLATLTEPDVPSTFT